MVETGQARAAGRRAANSKTMDLIARLGLACRGVLYLLIGILAFEVALGQNAQADKGGALRTVASQPLGLVLVWILAVGFAGLTIWKITEIIWGPREVKDRLLNAARAIVYAAACAGTVSFIVGSSSSNSDAQSQTATAEAMQLPGGQVIVGLVGAGVVITGIVFVVQAFRRDFEEDLKTGEMSHRTRKVVRMLGVVGHTARGVVVGAVGVFVLIAAITFDPDKAKGLDDTLKTFRDTPAGPYLLGLVALGLCVFAVFCGCEARWHRT